jgi:hypothetical protein
VWEETCLLQKFLQREVNLRRASIEEALKIDGPDSNEIKDDVLSRLVLANLNEGKNRLSDSELVGDVAFARYYNSR